MIKIKLGAFSTVSAIILGALVLPRLSDLMPTNVEKLPGNVIHLNQQVDERSIRQVLSYLKDANAVKGDSERVLLEITSPGGSVFEGRKLERAISKSVPVDTYIPTFGASMGGDLWIMGIKRYVEPGAMVLFHGAHAGTYARSQPILEKKLAILESDKFKEYMKAQKESFEKGGKGANSPYEPTELKYVNDLEKDVLTKGYDLVLMELRSELDILRTINESMLDNFQTMIDQSKGLWTRDRVRKEIFDNFSRDMVFTGRQLVEMGVATALGSPAMEDYKEFGHLNLIFGE